MTDPKSGSIREGMRVAMDSTGNNEFNFERWLNASAATIVGASVKHLATPQLIQNLLSPDTGFAGPLYLVNKSRPVIGRHKVLSDVTEVEGDPGIVFLLTPRLDWVELLSRMKQLPSGVVIHSSGAGAGQSPEFEEKLVKWSRETGVPVLGPQSAGFLSLPRILATTAPVSFPLLLGKVGLIAQSGGILHAFLHTLNSRGIGVSCGFAVGAMRVLGFRALGDQALRQRLAVHGCGGHGRRLDGLRQLDPLAHCLAQHTVWCRRPGAERRPQIMQLQRPEGVEPLVHTVRVKRHVLCRAKPDCGRQQRVGDSAHGHIERVAGEQKSRFPKSSDRAEIALADAAQGHGIAGKPAHRIEARRHCHHAGGRDAPVAGADAVETAKACRHANRTAGIGAERKVAKARRNGGCRAARRPARHVLRRLRIDRSAEMGIDPEHAAGDFVGMRLADEPGAGEQWHQHRGRGSDRRFCVPQAIRIAPGAARPGDVEQVLDRKA